MTDTKLRDAIYGTAIGDALGVPYEFMERDTFVCTGMAGHGTHNQPKGTWSDDTSMALATAKSLKDNHGAVDLADIRHNFELWLYKEEFNCNGRTFDVGNTTANAIIGRKGCTDVMSNGNGSLMRIIPLAFTECTDDEIRAVSAITHGHRISTEACVIYVHLARRMLAEPWDRKEDRKAYFERLLNEEKYEAPFERLSRLPELSRDEIRSTGYVVDTLEAAVWCLVTTESFEECLLKAVNLGKDTDTVGAVAGGLAGIFYDFSEFPKEYIRTLRNKTLIGSCLF